MTGMIFCGIAAELHPSTSKDISGKKNKTPGKNAHIVGFNAKTGGPLHIHYSDGTDIEIPLEKGRFGNGTDLTQETFSSVQLAEDGQHIGWLADYMICEQSYPCSPELVIYQFGHKRKYISPPYGVIWNWHFANGGKQVLIHSGFPHGDEKGTTTLNDTETGHESGNPSSVKKKFPIKVQ
jgi:hypothetical protein